MAWCLSISETVDFKSNCENTRLIPEVRGQSGQAAGLQDSLDSQHQTLMVSQSTVGDHTRSTRHRFSKTGKIGIMLCGLMSLDLCCDIGMVRSQDGADKYRSILSCVDGGVKVWGRVRVWVDSVKN